MPLPGSLLIGGFGSLIGGASISAGPIAGTLADVNSGISFISGMALWPLAALDMSSVKIEKTRTAAVQAKTKWMIAEYHLFISTILFPGGRCVSERGINA